MQHWLSFFLEILHLRKSFGRGTEEIFSSNLVQPILFKIVFISVQFDEANAHMLIKITSLNHFKLGIVGSEL